MNWNFRMAVAAANIALYGKSYSNGRLRDIELGCSHPLILCAMVEAVGSHRSSSRRQLLAIPSTSTARCTFLTLVIGLCRPRLETENSWQALANKVPVMGRTARSELDLRMFYELFIRILCPAVSKRSEAGTSLRARAGQFCKINRLRRREGQRNAGK